MTEGKIVVKLHLDATEFHAELDKVIERLEKLAKEAPAEAQAALGTIKASFHQGGVIKGAAVSDVPPFKYERSV